jgi:hypothetical protein
MNRLPRSITWPFLALIVLMAGCARVAIDDPDNGDFVNATTMTVTGNVFSIDEVDNPIDVEDLTLEINGANVVIAPDGSYSTNIVLDPNAVFNPVVADLREISTGYVDSDRIVVIVGDSIADGDFSPESIALQINASGLDALQPVVSSLVDLDLPSLLPVGSVVADNLCVIDSFLGCLGRATISIANPAPSISSFDVDFNPETNQVHTEVSLTDFDLNVFIDGGPYVLVPNCDLNLMASAVTLAGDFALEPDALTPSKVDVAQNGGISTMFANFDQTFTSGACDAFLIGDIIQLILGDLEPLVRSSLENFLNTVDGKGNTVIASAIESALAGVDISGPVGEALNANLDAPFFQVVETTQGITLGSDARFVADIGTGPGQCDPPATAPDLSASYHVAQPFPSFGPTSPQGTPYDIGLGISSSGFNQLLKSQIECGLLVATITEIDLFNTGVPQPLTAGLLSTFVPQLANFKPSEPARIELAPTIAPLITGAPGPLGELALLKVAQLNMKVFVTVTLPEDAVDVEVVEVMLDADVGLDLGFDAVQGALVFQLAEPDPSFVTAKSVENPIGAELTTLDALLPFVVSSFLPSLAGGLGSFPVPSFLGLELNVLEVARNGEMLTLYADLQ